MVMIVVVIEVQTLQLHFFGDALLLVAHGLYFMVSETGFQKHFILESCDKQVTFSL